MAMPINKTAVWGIIFSLLLAVTFDLEARERRGVWLRIEKSDGSLVEGELLKVSGETLFLFDKNNQLGVQLSLSEVRQFGVRHRTDIVGKMAIGMLVGAGVGLAAAMLFSSRSNDNSFGVLIISELLCIPAGAWLMASAGRFRGDFKKRQVAGLPDEGRLALSNELKSLSREMRNYHPDIMR
jgi:hypothetical protein